MSGHVLPVLPKRLVDFTGLPVGGSGELILADRVSLLHWRELTLQLQVFSHTLTGGNIIRLYLVAESWTEEDPGMKFLTDSFPPPSLDITSATLSPGYLTTTVSGVYMMLIRAVGIRAATGPMTANLGLEFSLKDA